MVGFKIIIKFGQLVRLTIQNPEKNCWMHPDSSMPCRFKALETLMNKSSPKKIKKSPGVPYGKKKQNYTACNTLNIIQAATIMQGIGFYAG